MSGSQDADEMYKGCVYGPTGFTLKLSLSLSHGTLIWHEHRPPCVKTLPDYVQLGEVM